MNGKNSDTILGNQFVYLIKQNNQNLLKKKQCYMYIYIVILIILLLFN
jgi:hypothetical protein